MNIGVGSHFEIFTTFDLSNNQFLYTVVIDGNKYLNAGPLTAINYGSWQFDSFTNFYICSDEAGLNTASCLVDYFSVSFSYAPTTEFQYVGGFDGKFLLNCSSFPKPRSWEHTILIKNLEPLFLMPPISLVRPSLVSK